MPNLAERVMVPELMDDDGTDLDTFRACLVDLANVNRLTLAYRPTISFLDHLVRTGRLPKRRPLAIVDVGSGYGDMLRKIDRWAKRRGVAVKLTGVDLNPWSARSAEDASPEGCSIRWVTANVFDFRPQEQPDVIISALFTHHLDTPSLLRFITWMEANAALGWFVNDLHRHPIPYHVFRLLSRALRYHYFVQHDGPISIARAFNTSEWQQMLASAGIPIGAAKIDWCFPFRICVERLRSP
jgi:2-polyprenyl-3-methyl-5-hydroxy-6-metoxy-1,4-benzoquinol methylase